MFCPLLVLILVSGLPNCRRAPTKSPRVTRVNCTPVLSRLRSTSQRYYDELRRCRVMLYTVTVLELASGRVDRRQGVKTDPPNLFTNISRGVRHFRQGVEPP